MLRTTAILVVLCASTISTFAQETPPAPSAPKSGTVPAVREKKLPNGMTVAVIERKNVPLVTIQLLIKGGASSEDAGTAGLADMTASMLTKGTSTKTASQIAEAIEFLGGTISSGAFWSGSFVSVSVTADKVDQALAILADVTLRPKFDQSEIDLLKTQTLDGLTYNLKQPSFLASYVASKYSFGEHPVGGTPESIKKIDQKTIGSFYKSVYRPDNAVLIFAGDITPVSANSLSQKYFGAWRRSPAGELPGNPNTAASNNRRLPTIVVIDLPKSGQAAVNYTKKLEIGRLNGAATIFYPATVFNSVLGGGYSSRLNYEIRIKRGLSYGAGSDIRWRPFVSNFSTSVQTKNESAAEVVSLILAEIDRMAAIPVEAAELIPRKAVVTGNFDRNLETTDGLAVKVSDLYAFGIPTSQLNSYVNSVTAVTSQQIQDFSAKNTKGGDIIIVGDYSAFKDDLAKRFPNLKVDVIKADDLDLSKDNLRK